MNLLYDKLTELGFEVERPGGTFYIFPKALEEDANAFCLKAREFDLLLVPSDTFGVKGYVRFAYCIDTEKVKRSLPDWKSWPQPIKSECEVVPCIRSPNIPARVCAGTAMST